MYYEIHLLVYKKVSSLFLCFDTIDFHQNSMQFGLCI